MWGVTRIWSPREIAWNNWRIAITPIGRSARAAVKKAPLRARMAVKKAVRKLPKPAQKAVAQAEKNIKKAQKDLSKAIIVAKKKATKTAGQASSLAATAQALQEGEKARFTADAMARDIVEILESEYQRLVEAGKKKGKAK